MREHADVGQSVLRVVGEGGGGLGHLHEAEHAFIHPRAAAGGNDDDGQFLFRCALDEPREFFADDRAHRAAEEIKIHHAEPRAVRADFANARDDRVLERRGFLVFLQFRLVGGDTIEVENVHARHLRVHFLKGAGLDERMDAFARADGEMMIALGADLQVFVQFLVIDHRAALRAFRPKPLRDVAFFGFGAGRLELFGQRRLAGRRRCQRRFDRFNAKRLFGKSSRAHLQSNHTKDRAPLSRRKHQPRRRPEAPARTRSWSRPS